MSSYYDLSGCILFCFTTRSDLTSSLVAPSSDVCVILKVLKGADFFLALSMSILPLLSFACSAVSTFFVST